MCIFCQFSASMNVITSEIMHKIEGIKLCYVVVIRKQVRYLYNSRPYFSLPDILALESCVSLVVMSMKNVTRHR